MNLNEYEYDCRKAKAEATYTGLISDILSTLDTTEKP